MALQAPLQQMAAVVLIVGIVAWWFPARAAEPPLKLPEPVTAGSKAK